MCLYVLLPATSVTSGTVCEWGEFSLSGSQCQPWLDCHAMSLLSVGDLLGYGAVKKVYASVWESHPVALVFLHNEAFLNDFLTGLNNLKILQLYPGQVVKLVGHCEQSRVYVSELHTHADAANFHGFISHRKFLSYQDEFNFRFDLCTKYVEIITTLHSFPLGPLVMCDSNTLEKTLEQYLLSDDKLLFLSDTDALPMVTKRKKRLSSRHSPNSPSTSYSCPSANPYTNSVDEMSMYEPSSGVLVRSLTWSAPGLQEALHQLHSSAEVIRCGQRQITGDFAAPEQRHVACTDILGRDHKQVEIESPSNEGTSARRAEDCLALYDEATDIFKIPDVCEFFLGDAIVTELVEKLSLIRSQCKKTHPFDRPTAVQVLQFYRKLRSEVDTSIKTVP